MPRKTQYQFITSPELLEQVNSKNKRLMGDYMTYLRSIQRSEKTIESYRNDLEIFMVWCLQNADNKSFADITKRDIIAFQNYLIYTNGNSPARVRRIKATLSSMSNYIEAILDDEPEFKDFRNIVKKVENPVNQPVREKTVFSDEELQSLLDMLVERKEYQKACLLALAMCSGRRKSELVRFKVDYFKDENIIYGSLYKTPEKIKTKGRSLGKFLYVYTLVQGFRPYLELWLAERERLGIDSEWLFVVSCDEGYKQMEVATLNSYADTFSRMLGMDFYWHSMRHYFTTYLSRMSIPAEISRQILGWDSSDMVALYDDRTTDDELALYFDENGIKAHEAGKLSDL